MHHRDSFMEGSKVFGDDLQDRVAIVTGGTCGIGCEIARCFVSHGCRVIMVNAREEECLEAITRIQNEVGLKARIEWEDCDMSDLCRVKEVFTSIRNRESRLDFCIFSAGIDSDHLRRDVNCIDAYFGMLWLGHFLACNVLWPLLRKMSRMKDTPAPRIVFEVPEQYRAPSDMSDDSLDETHYQRTVSSEIYSRAKASLILGIRYGIVDRIIRRQNDNIYALAVQPSGVNAMVFLNLTEQPVLFSTLAQTMLEDDERYLRHSSCCVLYAATSPEVEEEYMNGSYLADVGTPGKESKATSDPSLGPGFWSISERAIKTIVGPDALVSWNL